MAFSLFKSPLPQGCFEGCCDVHSHLLPGVDDGFPTKEKTVEALKWLVAHGIRKVKMTPHFMKDYPENKRATIEARYHAFVEENGASVPVELSLGGEYMLDSHFMDRFEEGFLTLDREGVLVLCETSYLNREPGAKEHLYEIMLKGYQPVIAHPERYQYADKAMYQRWKQRDYLFQLNLLSLGGAYGGPAKAKALQLLKDGMYDYVGSDLHRLNSVEERVRSIRLTKKETDQLLKLLENNKTL